tara:strand:- start:18598 stop:18783 length:186 start_codon:yes stop_codon:yes gene_type:complete
MLYILYFLYLVQNLLFDKLVLFSIKPLGWLMVITLKLFFHFFGMPINIKIIPLIRKEKHKA